MTDPNDDLSSVADPGSLDPHDEQADDLTYDEVHDDEQEPGLPGQAPDSVADQQEPPD